MRVLVACEYSGVVREAFRELGYDAWSCDLLPADDSSPYHYQGDAFDIVGHGWDLMIAHPPCTHIAVSGGRHFEQKRKDGRQQEGIDLFMRFINAPISRVAIENPVSIMSTKFRKPDQYVQPYEFGDATSKKTCLWLKGLPKLVPTNIVVPEKIINSKGKVYDKWWYETCSLPLSVRGKVRSKTFQGIANAMAQQWGDFINEQG